MDYQLQTLKDKVESEGSKVTVSGHITKELLNEQLFYAFTTKNNFKLDRNILRLERVSHRDVSIGFKRIQKKLLADRNTRKAVFISYHCVSAIQCLVRNEDLYCNVFFRSSNVEHLETDLHTIASELLKLKEFLNLKVVILSVFISSSHVIKNARNKY